jgi:hypothetical protein
MTAMQKILRPVLNFLTERFFPNGCFYGQGYLDNFNYLDDERGIGYAAVLSLSSSLFEINATDYKIDVEQLSLNGKDMGDWSLTMVQVSRGADFPYRAEGGVYGMTDKRNFNTGERVVEFQDKKESTA